MRIAVTRGGGFAGIKQQREIDTAKLSPAERREIEELVTRARGERPSPATHPDEFEYEITIDGERYPAGPGAGAWGRLIDALSRISSKR